MIKLNVPDMTCGHCVSTVEKAIKGVDAKASVKTDLASKTVTVESAAAAAALSKAATMRAIPTRPCDMRRAALPPFPTTQHRDNMRGGIFACSRPT